MNLVRELMMRFSTISINSAIPFEYIENSWIIRNTQGFGVAIENEFKISINEKASSVRIWNGVFDINGEKKELLFLTSNNTYSRNEFATICAEFVDYGENGSNRDFILKTPLKWWEKWKSLLGNTISEKRVYDVLGELLVYEKITKSGKKASWSAENYGIVDITSDLGNYEVKSTIGRYGNKITISSQYQLSIVDNLHIILCILEPEGTSPVSINDVVSRLNLNNDDMEALELKLDALGYEKSSSARNKKFSLVEMRDYIVDDNFPKITNKSFIDGKIPVGIVKLSYEISLDGLEYSNF